MSITARGEAMDVVWTLAIYALTIVDAIIGLPHKYSLKRILPEVRWFDCVVYFFPFAGIIWLTVVQPNTPWVLIGGLPLMFLWGLYFLVRMPALRRGSQISTQELFAYKGK